MLNQSSLKIHYSSFWWFLKYWPKFLRRRKRLKTSRRASRWKQTSSRRKDLLDWPETDSIVDTIDVFKFNQIYTISGLKQIQSTYVFKFNQMNISFKKEEENEWNLINKISYENGWNSPTDGSPHSLLPIQRFTLVAQNLKN